MAFIGQSSSTLVPPVSRFPDVWAKSAVPPNVLGESIESHTLQVWRNLQRLRLRAPALSDVCKMPRLWLRAAVAVMFHDLGKCCKGFQDVIRGGAKFRHRHEVLSVALVTRLLPLDPYADLPWISAAVLTHHRDLDEIGELYPDEVEFDGLEQLENEATPEFFKSAESIFLEVFLPLLRQEFELEFTKPQPAEPLGARRLIRPALQSAFDLARRIRNHGAGSSEAIAGRFLRGLLLLSDHAGSAGEVFGVLDQIGSEEAMLSALQVDPAKLYTHQRNLQPGNATLIAPTGSGKTEASMLWAARTAASEPGKPVIFYVLPYQASINAMQARLESYLGESKVALQHSRAVQAIYRQLLSRNYEPSLAAHVARKAKSLARLHAKPVRVLTPYQLLRGAYQLKGHEALWTDASKSLMIFDEIHAYDPVRLGMILATVRHLSFELGVRCLIMSATLPDRLLHILRSLRPNSSHLSATAETFAQFRRHQVQLLDFDLLDPAVLDRVQNDAWDGKAVLVVATTVARAQQIYRQLRTQLCDRVSLLHGRFNAEDRFDKEKKLTLQRGPKGEAPVVLVATQVVEVSLDVDFDVLYSDPAPLEALVQRFGRVNRRRRVPLRDVFVMRRIPEGEPVYRTSIVLAALDQLEKVDGLPLDESIVQEMLNAIYDGPIGNVWDVEVQKNIADFQRNVLDSLLPFRSSDELASQFDDLFDGFEVLPKMFEAEFERRKEEDELSAPALLVPITRGQFFSIKPILRNGTLIADCPYSSEEGLQITVERRLDSV
jgi:CRISPR-associated endonuclease/helicase Cas3